MSCVLKYRGGRQSHRNPWRFAHQGFAPLETHNVSGLVAHCACRYNNKCDLSSCNPAAFADLLVGAPPDAAWDAETGVMLPEYVHAMFAEGACARAMPLTEDG